MGPDEVRLLGIVQLGSVRSTVVPTRDIVLDQSLDEIRNQVSTFFRKDDQWSLNPEGPRDGVEMVPVNQIERHFLNGFEILVERTRISRLDSHQPYYSPLEVSILWVPCTFPISTTL